MTEEVELSHRLTIVPHLSHHVSQFVTVTDYVIRNSYRSPHLQSGCIRT